MFEDENIEIDEDLEEIMENHDLEPEEAERVRDIRDEYGVDEDDAVELVEEFGEDL